MKTPKSATTVSPSTDNPAKKSSAFAAADRPRLSKRRIAYKPFIAPVIASESAFENATE